MRAAMCTAVHTEALKEQALVNAPAPPHRFHSEVDPWLADC
jgi:hypothetical protein